VLLFYSAFGLTLSANRPLPGLHPCPASAAADVRLWLQKMPAAFTAIAQHRDTWYVSDERDDGVPSLRVWRSESGDCFRLLYSDGVDFVVASDGSEVWAAWPDSSSLEDAATYLLGPILGFVLRLRGVACLHASAVAVGNRAIVLLGPAGAGKSTTAAAFAGMGHPVLTDDVVAMTESAAGIMAQPAFPQIRLWPDAVALLFGTADALPRLTPSWDKCALDLAQTAGRFRQQPLPIGAIYVLAERAPTPEPRVDGVHGREALMTLVANAYVSYLQDASMRSQEFDSLGRVAAAVPLRRVVPPADPPGVSRLCRVILTDCEALGCTASATTAR
jgi:hypothetical protein